MLDAKALAETTAKMVKVYVDKATSPLIERVAALEAIEIPTAINGQDGRDGVDGKDGEPGLPGEKGADGRDADPQAIIAELKDYLGAEVRKEVEAATATNEPILTDEEKAAIVSMLFRKELGDAPITEMPEPVPYVAPVAKAPPPVIIKMDNPVARKGVEKTIVTKHDERGRILEFERREV